MPLERGGRADKMGNRYEVRCIIYEMLKVLRGRQTSWEKYVYSSICQDMSRYAKICQETKGKIDYDQGFIHLPRQYTNLD